MRIRNLLLAVFGIGFAALVILPLRAIKERAYICEEAELILGTIRAEVDGTYYPLRVSFWYDGLQTDAPYRLRIFFHPSDAAPHEIKISRVTISSSGVSHQLAIRAEGSWQRDTSGNPVFIIGFLDVPLTSHDAVADLQLSLDGTSTAAKLSLARTTKTKIVHSGLEAIRGI